MTGRDRTLRHLEALLALTALAASAASDANAEDKGKSKPATPEKPVDLGYSVVDELPPPAACANFAGAIRARATVLGGQVLVHLEPQPDVYDPATNASVAIEGSRATPLTHGMLVRKSAIPDTLGWVFQIAPDPGAQAFALVVSGSCDGRRSGAQVEVRWEGELLPSSMVTFTVLPTADPNPPDASPTAPTPAGTP